MACILCFKEVPPYWCRTATVEMSEDVIHFRGLFSTPYKIFIGVTLKNTMRIPTTLKRGRQRAHSYTWEGGNARA